MLLSPPFLIVGVLLAPLLLTFQRDLVILGISRQLFSVIIAASPTLALRPAAHALLRTINGREK
jgi:hypothetical protein